MTFEDDLDALQRAVERLNRSLADALELIFEVDVVMWEMEMAQ